MALPADIVAIDQPTGPSGEQPYKWLRPGVCTTPTSNTAEPGDEVERMMYGWSILHCLPVGLADQPSAGTGTVMREDTLRAYASEAGLGDVRVLPVDNDFFRLYRLTP